MTIDRIFFCYMIVAGAAAGTALVMSPKLGDGWLSPFFWILIAAGLFEAGVYARTGRNPASTLSGGARVFGFIAGVLLMAAIVTVSGSPARFF